MGCRRTDGFVLILALLLMLMMSALGAAFSLITSSETMVATNFRNSQEALYAADAAAERAIGEVAAAGDWSQLLNGSVRSTFVDGPPSGTRTLPSGVPLDLAQVVSQASCHKTTTCSSAEMDAVTADRPRGVNNPRWQLFSSGRLRDVLPVGSIDSAYYVVVLIGDDASETDGDPLRDATSPAPGAGIVTLRAQAFGPRNARRTVEVTIARTATGHVRLLSWRA